MHYDPDTISLLCASLEQAWASLPPEQRQRTSRDVLAMRLLRRAAKGERDPARLRTAAILEVVVSN